jgi:hypothetical protein
MVLPVLYQGAENVSAGPGFHNLDAFFPGFGSFCSIALFSAFTTMLAIIILLKQIYLI